MFWRLIGGLGCCLTAFSVYAEDKPLNLAQDIGFSDLFDLLMTLGIGFVSVYSTVVGVKIIIRFLKRA